MLGTASSLFLGIGTWWKILQMLLNHQNRKLRVNVIVEGKEIQYTEKIRGM